MVEKGRKSRFCLQHIPKRFWKHKNSEYGYGYYEHTYKIRMQRLYTRSQTGKRGFIPFGWWCPKCKKIYFDKQIDADKHEKFCYY